MIEVEVRGRLTKDEFEKLKEFLTSNGRFIRHRDREMFLLYDYPGYSHNPIEREVDIRLRNTNGECEIMLKKRVSEGNVSRKEISLKLADKDLEKAKQIVKAFGCAQGLQMQRVTDVFNYKDIEWSLVETPKNIFYFEAEKESPDEQSAAGVESGLRKAAAELGLKTFDHKETEEFISFLDKEVNVEVEL